MTGLSLGPPLGDQRFDLCDLSAFASPAEPDHTVVILNVNPNVDALRANAVYRLAIDRRPRLPRPMAISPRIGTRLLVRDTCVPRAGPG